MKVSVPMSIDNRNLGFDAEGDELIPEEVAYRHALAEALEKVLDQGAETLEAISAGLDALEIAAPKGAVWSPQTLETELSRLAR